MNILSASPPTIALPTTIIWLEGYCTVQYPAPCPQIYIYIYIYIYRLYGESMEIRDLETRGPWAVASERSDDALDEPYNRFRLCVRSNKISSLVQSPAEMKAFFCDETDEAELDIDALMLPASQHYERTLLTPSRPNVGPNLPAPSSTVQFSVAAPVSRPRLSSIPRIPRVVTTPPGYFQWQSCIFTHLDNKFSRGGNKFTRGGNK